jgi:hypothetical protein
LIFSLIDQSLYSHNWFVYFSHFIADQKEINSLGCLIEHNYCPSDGSDRTKTILACSSCTTPLFQFPSSSIKENKEYGDVTDMYNFGNHFLPVIYYFFIFILSYFILFYFLK